MASGVGGNKKGQSDYLVPDHTLVLLVPLGLEENPFIFHAKCNVKKTICQCLNDVLLTC